MPDSTKVFGTRIPNLVLVYDNEKGYEFRVQCEVPISDAKDAKALFTRLTVRGVNDLNVAKELVMAHVNPGASETFRAIMEMAFKDNVSRMKAPKRRPASKK